MPLNAFRAAVLEIGLKDCIRAVIIEAAVIIFNQLGDFGSEDCERGFGDACMIMGRKF